MGKDRSKLRRNSKELFRLLSYVWAATLWLVVIAGFASRFSVAESFPHGPQDAAETPKTDVHTPKSTLTNTPKVDWNVDWAVTRTRPGYPLLENTQHSTVHTASAAGGAYHHHPQITYFQNCFFAVWSHHPSGEDGPGQDVIGAKSPDGLIWTSLGTVFDRCDKIAQSTGNGRSLIASPFVEFDNRLFAVTIVNDGVGYGTSQTPVTGQPLSETKTEKFGKRIRRPCGYLLREVTSEGGFGPVFWIGNKKPAPFDGFPEFPDPKHLSDSTLEKIRQELKNPVTQSPWDFESPQSEVVAKDGSRLTEPTTQMLNQDLLIRYLRDNNGSQKLYVQFSDDNGDSWTLAEPTNIPDAPAKSVFGRLPGGQFFLIGNQVVSKRGTRRDPLTIGISKNGVEFKKAYAIRWRTPKFQIESQQNEPDGRGRGFQYPSFVVAKDALWVIYSVNKEAIEISRVDIGELIGTDR